MTIRTDGARWIGWLRAVCVLTLGLAAPAMAMGDGLAGSYWNFNVVANGNAFPGGAPNRTRVDATVNFDWGNGAPTGGINADDFAVRWDGMLEAPQSGNYIFSTQSDDGVRLWINGALVIDNWTQHAPTWNDSATVSLVAGQRYVVRMEMFERGGGAVARLYWRKPSDIAAGIARNVIPQAQLFSQVSPTVVSVVQPCNDLNTVRVTFSRPMTSGNGKASAERKQNYDIDGSAPSGINVTDAVLEADQQTVVLTLNKALIAGNTYTLEVKDVEASNGVPIVPDPSTFTFVAGEGNGLTASYWNFDVFGSGNAFPSGPATHVRQDAPVDFNWATSSPVPGIVNADLFAVRWDGFVEAPSTGDYTFWTQSDDGVRLWVNGNLVINNWTLHGATWDSAAPVALQAGQRYAIRMELYERTGDAVARLHWQTPGSAVRTAVPANRLSSCGGAATIDHVRLLHPGSGLTCAASDITVQACANADCSVLATDAVTVSLFSTPASAFTPAPVVLNGGSAVVSIRQTAPGPVTLDAIASAPLATAPTRCFVGASETCVMDFHDSGFLIDAPTQTACKTSNDVTIQAVRTDDTTQTCAPAFTGARSVSFWSEYVSPASGTKTLQVNGTDVAGIAPGTAMTLNFDASATATITVNYPDAGLLNLHARYIGSGSDAGLVLDGVDAFVSKPVGFDV
ncbi:MAG: PA14 domain-containing protein, partial [Xanthomonadaceae bacterium]|nr:PA14 domain-containing protein [Xanthomonadaceae bacterium]